LLLITADIESVIVSIPGPHLELKDVNGGRLHLCEHFRGNRFYTEITEEVGVAKLPKQNKIEDDDVAYMVEPNMS